MTLLTGSPLSTARNPPMATRGKSTKLLDRRTRTPLMRQLTTVQYNTSSWRGAFEGKTKTTPVMLLESSTSRSCESIIYSRWFKYSFSSFLAYVLNGYLQEDCLAHGLIKAVHGMTFLFFCFFARYEPNSPLNYFIRVLSMDARSNYTTYSWLTHGSRTNPYVLELFKIDTEENEGRHYLAFCLQFRIQAECKNIK